MLSSCKKRTACRRFNYPSRRSPAVAGLPVRVRYRRISGILFPLRGDCHFSRPAVAHRFKRPTLRRRTSNPFEAEAPLSLYLGLQPIRFTPAECRHPPRELVPRVFTLTCCRETFQETSLQQAVYFSVALSVALADTFLLRSMVLCAVPTFLAPAFPTRDSLPESRCKSTEFLVYGTAKPWLFGKIKQDFRIGKAHFAV